MRVVLTLCFWVAACATARADVTSGPAGGEAVASLKVHCVTGDSAGKSADVAADRGEKPAVYLFIRHDQWSRPMARFIKVLDEAAKKRGDTAIVAVWITEDPEKVKEYLPLVQQSLKLEATSLAVYETEKTGPATWGVNGDAHLTAVVAHRRKVGQSFGFVSVNETLVKDVEAALAKAIDPDGK